MNLKQKIIEVRKQVSFLQKDTQGYGYKYVSEDKVLFAIKDKMDELGLLLVPSVTNHDVKPFTYLNSKNKETTENIVHGDITFTWYDSDSEEELIVPFGLFGMQQDAAQAFGSALTYSNRYFLLKFFQVATNENDPDKVRSTQRQREEKEYTEEQRIKKNMPDKMLLEANNDQKLTRKVMDLTLAEFGFKNWKEYNPSEVSEQAFMSMFTKLLGEQQ